MPPSSGPPARNHVADLRGATRLAIEATRGVTSLVEAMQRRIAAGPAILGRPLDRPVAAILGLTYGSIRGVTGVVGTGLDLALGQLMSLLPRQVDDGAPGPGAQALRAVLNGVVGDYLEETGNPLAIPMCLRVAGRPVALNAAALRHALPSLGGKPLLLVHGSSMSDLQWTRRGHDHGAALARDLGYTPLYLHYNSGRHVSTNGRELAGLLEALLAAWPVPDAELTILAHSMGGLVSRSACDVAAGAGHRWLGSLRKLIFLGTPHHGAPLERMGTLLDLALGISDYSEPLARLGKIRSAGVTDLRYGNLRDEDWQGRDRFQRGRHRPQPVPLPSGVTCYAAAASRSREEGPRLSGDGLVPVYSALGRHRDPARALTFPDGNQWIGRGMGHLDLLDNPDVYQAIVRWLR